MVFDQPLFKNALITGCGGDVAISLSRIARNAGIFSHIMGTDISSDHPADIFFDQWEVICRADDANYFTDLERILSLLDIDLIIPTTDREISAFHQNGFTTHFMGIPVVMASDEAVAAGLDKLSTVHALKNIGLDVPWTIVTSAGHPLEFPCIIKPLKGQGSKGLRIVSGIDHITPEDISDDMIWQELLGTADQEYTSGLYRSRQGDIRCITFQRRLSGGLTSRAILTHDEGIDNMLVQIAQKLDLTGSINIQFRMTQDGPRVFEINPRFSSTVAFRDKLGFHDFIWSVLEILNHPLPPYKAATGQIRLYKTFEEQIIYPDSRPDHD
ncbi:MAG: ATP-grasp domain-containing protein [Alphaproteobacteria bacterium]|nr:ATP-grasp domain-containing protein [Alphaproteobacteria bacterium]